MTEKKKYKDPLELLLSGERIETVVKTRRGEFTISFPMPSDLREIEIKLADRLEGLPVASFAAAKVNTFRIYAVLDTVITKAPDWWNKLESSEACPDDSLITELYGRYLQCYQKTQKALAKGHFRGDVGKMRLKNENETVDNGAFSGITNG